MGLADMFRINPQGRAGGLIDSILTGGQGSAIRAKAVLQQRKLEAEMADRAQAQQGADSMRAAIMDPAQFGRLKPVGPGGETDPYAELTQAQKYASGQLDWVTGSGRGMPLAAEKMLPRNYDFEGGTYSQDAFTGAARKARNGMRRAVNDPVQFGDRLRPVGPGGETDPYAALTQQQRYAGAQLDYLEAGGQGAPPSPFGPPTTTDPRLYTTRRTLGWPSPLGIGGAAVDARFSQGGQVRDNHRFHGGNPYWPGDWEGSR